MWRGIDVSDHQGIINWAKVWAAGVDFAILRSIRRFGDPDKQFANNLAGCLANDIPVAVYKYTYAMSQQAAEKEAHQVIELLRKHGLQNTMIWWDVEDRDTLQGLTRAQLTACIQTVRTEIKTAGYRFGLYTGMNVWREKWFNFDAFAADPLWIARYYKGYDAFLFNQTPDYGCMPEVGRALWGWQYTSSGQVPGINGNVDLNVCYQNPSEQELPIAEPGTIYCVSVADVWDKAIAQAVAAAYPGCKVHRAQVLDVGGIVIWIASVADVWTEQQALEAQRQFTLMKIKSTVHKVKILE